MSEEKQKKSGEQKKKKQTGKKRGKVYNIVLSIIAVILAAVLVVGNILAFNVYTTTLDSFFTSFSESGDTETETDSDDWYAIAAEIESEGAVLLLNENDTLPLSGLTQINLLGYRSYNHVFSGTGSGATDSTSAVTLKAALENKGITVNPAPEDAGIYTISFTDDTEGMGLYSRFMGASFSLTNEPAVSEFTGDASFENMAAYSDTVIVTFGRIGGEGSDSITADPAELDGAEHFLELSDTEKELLQTACDTFETVIVLINSGNAMELGFLEEYDIDAALWVGDVGARGMEAVVDILTGDVNPSGRLTDTYAYDATSAPSYAYYGDFSFSNYENTYVNYAEGIYVGYRWYETADAEGFFDEVDNEYGTGYEGVVQFPFGYGLSYTTFEQEITGGTADGSVLAQGEDITVEVTVTNTGDVAGKDVVELYYTAPYTNGGIEKASVVLADFDKTQELAAGDSETLTITLNADDLASYDTSADGGNGAYVLEAGDYVLSIRSDSHTVLDEITLTVEEDIVYSESEDGARSSDETAAANTFEDAASGLAVLSRADSFANYDEVMSLGTMEATDEMIDSMENHSDYDASYDEIEVSYTEGVDYGASGSLTLEDMAGVEFEDELWDELISQMSLEDLTTLVTQGGWGTAAIDSVGKSADTHIDSSQGLVRVVGSTPILGTAYPSGIVQAATWNKDLMVKYASYYADEAHSYGVSGLYAPSINIHRSPFGGRNYEYFSEDPVLSGQMAAAFIEGAGEKGMITYIKHYALNEQDTNRSSAATFADEQTIREIYIKGFEEAVKNSDATAVMSSMNRIGTTWTGASYGLCTQTLRNEWGFTGYIITDATEGDYMYDVEAGLRAGNDMWLTSSTVTARADSDADIYYLQRAAKRILYVIANADIVEAQIAPWRTWMAILDAALVIAILALAALVVLNVRKTKNMEIVNE